MRIAIDIGHNAKGDRGATGVDRTEDSLTMELGQNLIKLLEQEGHYCVNVLPQKSKNVYDSLAQRAIKANKSRCDLLVSLHFNAFNRMAHGSEIFALGDRAQQIARRTLTEICKLGFYDRGVKRRNFYLLKHSTMPAILIESCFCDSAKDMHKYNAQQMAIAISNGILGKQGVYVPQEKTLKLRVKRHHTWVKPSTEQAQDILEKELQPIKKGLYTVVKHEPIEEGHFWVELKSGIEGFIFAGHAEIV